MQLFVDEGLTWIKTASAELEEDATQWPRQVLTELFRVLPEVSEYTPDVQFMKVNEEHGYALGAIVITNSTNSALAAEKSVVTQPPKAVLPIVVKNGKLSPIDTVMASSGKMYPLTAERLREVLYRPESFELAGDDWGDAGLAGLLMPPGGASTGGAGGSMQYMAGPGMGGQKLSMLGAISGTLLEPDITKLAMELQADPALVEAVGMNPALAETLLEISNEEPVTVKTAEQYEQLVADHEPVNVACIRFDEDVGAYVVKTASRGTGTIREFYLDRGQLLRFTDAKIAAEVDRSGAAMVSDKAADPPVVIVSGPSGTKPELISSPGYYTVFDAVTGVARVGWVIPRLIDGEGAQIPNALFANNEGSVVQDQIIGASGFESQMEEMTFSPPHGEGCFVVGRGGMDLKATVPVRVQSSTSEGQTTRYNCVDLFAGEPLTIVLQHGMRGIVAFPARKELVLPSTANFVSTVPELPTLVSQGPEDLNKVASELLAGKLTVYPDPSSFDAYRLELRNLPKLAAALPETDVDYDNAVFALCTAGLDVSEARQCMRKVASTGSCALYAEDIGQLPVIDPEKVAEEVSRVRETRVSLLKEAAALPDAMTVDAVLSLDFLNSENVQTFIRMIPYLEKALNKVCELVFASRLGLTEIPETATARAARGLNDAIRGLKSLALRQVEEMA